MIREQEKILQWCYKNPIHADVVKQRLRIDSDALNELCTPALTEYLQFDFIRFSIKQTFQINLRGKEYIQQLRRNGRQFWIPIAISNILALLALVVSLFK